MADPLTITAIGWGLTVADWLISPVLSRLIDQCFRTLGEDIPEKLRHLETTLLPQLKIIMEAAAHSPHRSTLEKWLQNLKDAFYEAEDMLDLVEYERREREVKSESSSRSRILSSLKPRLFSTQKNLLKSLQKLEKLVNEAIRDFVPLFQLPNSSDNNVATSSSKKPYRVTTSSPPPLVIGRDEDRDHIIKMLHEDSIESCTRSECFSVIGVYGIGGSGKTTLAQCICEYERNDNYFDLVMWVYVSREFDVYTILSKMLESVCGKSSEDFKNLDVLQNKIKEQLSGKKYLLVLDDVWCNKGDYSNELDQLFAPVRVGKRGSKILVTTRMKDVAKILGSPNPIKLKELDHEQFLRLLMHYALGDALTDDNNLEKELKIIGEKIAAKLHRSPLAARIVAGQLSKRLDPTFWSSMLRKDLLTDAMGALYLSYQHLDPNLQRCFAFCSLFPKGYLFRDDELLKYWIAEQFIENNHGNEHVRDVARRYLDELISSSFITHEGKKWGYERYSVHDILHDLAEMITKNEYCRIENGERKEISMRVQHLFVGVDLQKEHIENIRKLEGLRTIIIPEEQSNLKYSDLDALFMKLKKLRVVRVWGGGWLDTNSKARFPESITCQKHLRYLESSYSGKFCKRFNELYHLQFLYSDANHQEYICEIPYFGRLRSIQTIPYFSATENKGGELKQFENLRELYGSLELRNLENVTSKEEALSAQLSNKHGIKELTYHWSMSGEHEGDRINKDLEIFEGLCPPSQITDITIRGYEGQRYPNWISKINNSAENLHRLALNDCNYLESIELLPHLRFLSIKNLPRLRRCQPLPSTLNELCIEGCFSLAFISKEELERVLSPIREQMTEVVTFLENSHFYRKAVVTFLRMKASDQTLSVTYHDLENLLGKRFDLIWQLGDENNKLILSSSLKSLEIDSCALTNGILWKGLQGATSLTKLCLRDIITITSISTEVLSSVNKLQILEIVDCLFLKSLGGLETLGSLKKLEISYCPILTIGSTKLPSSLESLTLNYWRPPDDIFGGLVSLEILYVSGCPSTVSPDIGCSKSLKELTFDECSSLNSIRGLNHLSYSLRYIDVWKCPMLTCQPIDDKLCMPPGKFSIDKVSLVHEFLSREAIATLQRLQLKKLPREYTEAELEVFQHLRALTDLYFYDCIMDSLPTNILSLTSLKNLFIWFCRDLSVLPNLPVSLESIKIYHSRMDSLPTNILSLTSLKNLDIWFCRDLSVLPNLPVSLERIEIRHCSSEFMKSCKERGHPNFLKLDRIPKKDIR